MDKNEKQVFWELIKLRKAVLKKEPDPAKKRILMGWIRDGLRQMRVQKRAQKRVFAKVRRGKRQAPARSSEFRLLCMSAGRA